MRTNFIYCLDKTMTAVLCLTLFSFCGQNAQSHPDSTAKANSSGQSSVSKENLKTPAAAAENLSATGAIVTNADKKAAASADSSGPGDEKQHVEKLHELAVYHWNLSKTYASAGDLDLAQTELDLAVLNWPDMKIAHRDLCLVSLLRFNIWRSIAEFMMTVGLGDPVPLTAKESVGLMEEGMVKHYKKGLIYARQQNWPKTVNELELASDLVSDDFAVERALAFAYANLGNYSKAEEHYRATFALSPHDGSSRADLAYFLAKSGKLGEAEKQMEEAVKSQPQAVAYHVDLGFMAENRGELDTASRELQQAVRLSPRHADLWAHLGRLLERKGEKNQAIEAYSKAISLNPALTDTRQTLTKLQAEAI